MNHSERVSAIEKLANLRQSGALTEQEFQQEKRRILEIAPLAATEDAVTDSLQKSPKPILPNLEENADSKLATVSRMTVSYALAETQMDKIFADRADYYREKFLKIAQSADIENDDIQSDWKPTQQKILRRPSFNIWAAIFGPFWAIYRRLAIGWLWLAMVVAITVLQAVLDFDSMAIDRGIGFGSIGFFGILGNGYLLTKYLGLLRTNASSDQTTELMKPRPLIAVAIPLLASLILVAINSIESFDSLKPEELRRSADPEVNNGSNGNQKEVTLTPNSTSQDPQKNDDILAAEADRQAQIAVANDEIAPDAKIGDCLLEIRGVSYISGKCKYRLESDGSFQIFDLSGDYFAMMDRNGSFGVGYWNQYPKSTHAQTELGSLKRQGACWVNQTAKICVKKLI